MPVFWFAISFATNISVVQALIVFFILHVLVYPASNGYNSYMDRDETSIGGIEKPLAPTKELFTVTIVMDVLAILLSFFVSPVFATGVVFYTICSRLYSYRGVRLKQYPLLGYATVILNQGALTFFIVYHGVQADHPLAVPWQGVVAAAFLIGGFYPITQVYQHEADAKDNVKTISMLLGKRGTFIFCALMYLVAFGLLFYYYFEIEQLSLFMVLQLFFLPVIIYFLLWFLQVWKDGSAADFKHTMRMNWLASSCTSAAFITLTFIQQRG
jgi:1,4-dihydroxy-2-naphthoate polyprenyltransferase